MTERIPHATIDKLTESIWRLGCVAMADIVKIAPTPSRVKGELTFEDVTLEPEFIITNRDDFLVRPPRTLGMIVNSSEEYAPNDDFTLYSWRHIIIDTLSYRRTFYSGISILDDHGNTITPQLDVPTLSPRRRPGSEAWRGLTHSIDDFNVETAEEFIDLGNSFREAIAKKGRDT